MTEEQARKLAADCAEYFEAQEESDLTTVEPSYYSPGKSWRVVLTTGNSKTVFHELRDWKYVVRYHLAHL